MPEVLKQRGNMDRDRYLQRRTLWRKQGKKTHGKAKTDAWNHPSQLLGEGVPASAMTGRLASEPEM